MFTQILQGYNNDYLRPSEVSLMNDDNIDRCQTATKHNTVWAFPN